MIVLVALAGGLGAASRFVVDALIARRIHARVPLGTCVINVTGSLLLGLLIGLAAGQPEQSNPARAVAVLGTGFCGGYTTFSTASIETVRLWLGGSRRIGLAYAMATLVGSVAAAAAGLGLARLGLAAVGGA